MAHETREVACYLRNGSLWVGHFIVDDAELNFGDDRFDSVDGLAKLAYAEPARSTYKADPRVLAWIRTVDETVDTGTKIANSNTVFEQVKLAA